MASSVTDEVAGQSLTDGGPPSPTRSGTWVSLGLDDALLHEPQIDVIPVSDSDDEVFHSDVIPSVPKPHPSRIGVVSRPRTKVSPDAVARVQPSRDQCDEKIVYTPVQARELERVQRVQDMNRKHGWVEYEESAQAAHPQRLQLFPGLEVEPDIICQMKPLQANGIKFMFDSCYETIPPPSKDTKGAGCILAHTMGLGKTAQVVVMCHTMLTAGVDTDTTHVLILVPVSVVSNWNAEFYKWLQATSTCPNRYTCATSQKSYTVYTLDHTGADVWIENGGVLIASYQRFTSLVRKDKRMLSMPDLVVCDEGHYLKNDKGRTYSVIASLVTQRRILLTGTPIQNQLIEYHTLVQLIKPDLLGTRREFKKKYNTPIQNGLYSNSTPIEIEMMQNRSLVLYRLLGGCVMRRDTNVNLAVKKHEFVLFVPLTPIQVTLSQESLKLAKNANPHANHLFAAFQMLMRVWAHPRAIDISRYTTPLDQEKDLDSLNSSGKMAVVFALLDALVATEKVVIFSQSLNALDAIEFFLKQRPEFKGAYLRYDGSMSSVTRTFVLDRFNTNPSTRILLMSTKAGSTGISIVGASRAILFDLPWNPTTDAQSVGRIYRPGQENTCYVYRLVTSDAMEKLVYQQHVVKHGLSSRIIDDRERARLFPESEGLLRTNVADTPTNDEDMLRYRTPPTSDPDFALDALFAKSLVSYYYKHDDLLNTPTPPVDVLNCIERDQIWNSFTGDAPRPSSPEPEVDPPTRKPKSAKSQTQPTPSTQSAASPKTKTHNSHHRQNRWLWSGNNAQTNLAKKAPLLRQALLIGRDITGSKKKIMSINKKTTTGSNKPAQGWLMSHRARNENRPMNKPPVRTEALNNVLAANRALRLGPANRTPAQTNEMNKVLAANRVLGLGTATKPLAQNALVQNASATKTSAQNALVQNASATKASVIKMSAQTALVQNASATKTSAQLALVQTASATKTSAQAEAINNILAANRALGFGSATNTPDQTEEIINKVLSANRVLGFGTVSQPSAPVESRAAEIRSEPSASSNGSTLNKHAALKRPLEKEESVQSAKRGLWDQVRREWSDVRSRSGSRSGGSCSSSPDEHRRLPSPEMIVPSTTSPRATTMLPVREFDANVD